MSKVSMKYEYQYQAAVPENNQSVHTRHLTDCKPQISKATLKQKQNVPIGHLRVKAFAEQKVAPVKV